MVTISLHYWAGAKAAAGLAMERFEANSVAEALRRARDQRSDPAFDSVLSVSSVLIDGLVATRADLERPTSEPLDVEILPPFAGGAGGGLRPTLPPG